MRSPPPSRTAHPRLYAGTAVATIVRCRTRRGPRPVSLDDKLARVPDRPGVYLYRDAKAQVIYVGKAASLKSRVRSYFQESRAPRSQDRRAGAPDRRPRVHRDRQRARGADAGGEPGAQAPAALQHHPARRQALPVPQAHHRRGVPAAAGGPARAERRRHLLRPLLSGHRHAGDAAADPPAVPAAHLLDHHRRPAAAPVHPVRDPPLQRAVHRAGRRARATRRPSGT